MAQAVLYSKVQLPGESPDAIRLLKLEHKHGGHLACKVHKVELKKAPPYSALSYTWQWPLLSSTDSSSEALAAKGLFKIECNGEAIQLYYNLYHALHHLAQQPDCGGFLWVDAICIDQSNLEERSIQVNLMSQIFSAAEQVIIWLGPEDEHSKRALALLKGLCKLDSDQRRIINPYSLHHPEVKDLLGSTLNQKPYWVSLGHFFSRSWFSRAWVIQEFLLSSRLHVLCGEEEIPWDSLEVVSEYLATSPWTIAFKDPKFLEGAAVLPRHGGPAKLAATKKALDKGGSDILLHSLIRARTYSCKDPRDKVFSLYGVASEYAPQDRRVPQANYRLLEIHEVYKQAALNILDNSDDLHVLAHVEGEKFRVVKDLPSWVPDWSVTAVVGLGVTGYTRFWAAGELPRDMEVLKPSRRVLRLKAARIAHISMCGESKRDFERTRSVPRCIEILRSLATTYCTGKTKLEAFWRTLIIDTDPYTAKCPASDPLRESFEAWVHGNAVRQDSGSDPDGWMEIATLCQSCFHPGSQTKSDPEFDTSHPKRTKSYNAAAYDLAFTHRMCLRLFLTEEGFLGLGTESLADGDTIWIIPGSRVALVLREKSDPYSGPTTTTYELVGGCYLHGFMHEEALGSKMQERGLKPLEFEYIELE